MVALNDSHFGRVSSCPWCNGENYVKNYENMYEANVMECVECGLVFSNKILNERGLEAYWTNYESKVHNLNEESTKKRMQMYEVEVEFVTRYINVQNAEILDVGCAGGEFMDCFYKRGGICEGVEIGDEAYDIASKKYKVHKGVFPELEFDKKYDLIIFRGTIQYFINPKKYIKKAFELLKDGGLLYITSSPNADALCFKLFKEKFTLPVGVTDYYAFKESLLTKYINTLGGMLLVNHHFYLETPYANPVNDITKVAKKLEDDSYEGFSPPFYDNMLTLVYRKCERMDFV